MMAARLTLSPTLQHIGVRSARILTLPSSQSEIFSSSETNETTPEFYAQNECECEKVPKVCTELMLSLEISKSKDTEQNLQKYSQYKNVITDRNFQTYVHVHHELVPEM